MIPQYIARTAINNNWCERPKPRLLDDLKKLGGDVRKGKIESEKVVLVHVTVVPGPVQRPPRPPVARVKLKTIRKRKREIIKFKIIRK